MSTSAETQEIINADTQEIIDKNEKIITRLADLLYYSMSEPNRHFFEIGLSSSKAPLEIDSIRCSKDPLETLIVGFYVHDTKDSNSPVKKLMLEILGSETEVTFTPYASRPEEYMIAPPGNFYQVSGAIIANWYKKLLEQKTSVETVMVRAQSDRADLKLASDTAEVTNSSENRQAQTDVNRPAKDKKYANEAETLTELPVPPRPLLMSRKNFEKQVTSLMSYERTNNNGSATTSNVQAADKSFNIVDGFGVAESESTITITDADTDDVFENAPDEWNTSRDITESENVEGETFSIVGGADKKMSSEASNIEQNSVVQLSQHTTSSVASDSSYSSLSLTSDTSAGSIRNVLFSQSAKGSTAVIPGAEIDVTAKSVIEISSLLPSLLEIASNLEKAHEGTEISESIRALAKVVGTVEALKWPHG